MTSVSTLKFPEEISIANVTEWKHKLVDFLNVPSPLILDGENLLRVDTSAIQLMAAFVLKAVAQDKAVQWQNPSPALLQTVQQLGLKETLLLPAFKFTPILVLTTESSPEMKQRGKGAGATGWLVKPFNPEKLLSTIKRVVR